MASSYRASNTAKVKVPVRVSNDDNIEVISCIASDDGVWEAENKANCYCYWRVANMTRFHHVMLQSGQNRHVSLTSVFRPEKNSLVSRITHTPLFQGKHGRRRLRVSITSYSGCRWSAMRATVSPNRLRW